MKKLSELKTNESSIVQKIQCTGVMKRKILDMGITKGVSILIRKVAPLGDPIQVNVRGYELTLRKSEADLIEIEE